MKNTSTGMVGLVYGCVKICLILAIKKTFTTQRTPYGHKMCKQFCVVAGCSFEYTFPDLCCNATFHRGSTTARKSLVIERLMNNTLKHQDDMTVSSMTTFAASLSGEKKKTTSKNKTVQNLGLGLLVAPVPGGKRSIQTSFLHISLHNHTIKPFLGLSTGRVTALAHSSKHEIIFLGTNTLYNKILTYNTETQTYAIIENKFTPSDMSIDEARQQLFFTTKNPRTGVRKMSFSGKNHSVVAKNTCAGAVTLDRKRKTIYAACSEYIFCVSYNGQNFKTTTRGSITSALTIDKTSEGLYFNRYHDICYVLLGKKTWTVVVKLKRSASKIVLYDNTLYVSSSTSKDIFVISPADKKAVDKKVDHLELPGRRRYWLKMCLYKKTTNH